MTVGQAHERLCDPLGLRIVLQLEGPPGPGHGLGKGTLTPAPQLVDEQSVQARLAPRERGHVGMRRDAAAIDEDEGGEPHVGGDDRRGTDRHGGQPVDDDQGGLGVDTPSPELPQHAECHVARILGSDLHGGPVDQHPGVVEADLPCGIHRQVGQVGGAGDAVGVQELREPGSVWSVRLVRRVRRVRDVPSEGHRHHLGVALPRKPRRGDAEPDQRVNQRVACPVDDGPVQLAGRFGHSVGAGWLEDAAATAAAVGKDDHACGRGGPAEAFRKSLDRCRRDPGHRRPGLTEGHHGLRGPLGDVRCRAPEHEGFEAAVQSGDTARCIAHGTSSARSLTTMSAPWARSWAACPLWSTPTTRPKCPERPASTPASASSTTTADAGGTPSIRAASR